MIPVENWGSVNTTFSRHVVLRPLRSLMTNLGRRPPAGADPDRALACKYVAWNTCEWQPAGWWGVEERRGGTEAHMHITCFQPWLRLPPESEKCLVAMVLHRGWHYHARARWQVWRCVVHRCGESHSLRIGNPGWLRVCCVEIHFQAASSRK